MGVARIAPFGRGCAVPADAPIPIKAKRIANRFLSIGACFSADADRTPAYSVVRNSIPRLLFSFCVAATFKFERSTLS